MAFFLLPNFKNLNPHHFSNLLLLWSSDNQRDLPWKKDKDPYKIWISEIILQQTRVDQGTPYFLKFIHTFPNVKSLSEAEEDQVIKLWEGLGYYTRARNIHHTAKIIVEKYDGIFPTDYHKILSLKGVGPYTAAAIVSFAFDQKYAVVDGNVLRLISRLLGIVEAIDSNSVKKSITSFVTKGIANVDAAGYNQALMDFGATICTPTNPNCHNCPFLEYCIAHVTEKIRLIPYKAKKIIRTNRYFHIFDFDLPNGRTLLIQRKNTDIWKNLYQLPIFESISTDAPNIDELTIFFKTIFGNKLRIDQEPKCISSTKQPLTHQNIHALFYKIKLENIPHKINQDHYLVERTKVSNFAFPKIIADHFKTTVI